MSDPNQPQRVMSDRELLLTILQEIQELRANQREFRDEVLERARADARADAAKRGRGTRRRVLAADG